MTGFREHLDESLKDPAFRHEWSAQETEREVMKSIVKRASPRADPKGTADAAA